jgi:hypothetical protein
MTQSLIRGSTQIMIGTITADRFAASLGLATSQLAEGAKFIKSDGSVSMAAALNMASFGISNLATPVNAADAATKAYVDALANGLSFHASCRVLANTNLASLSGLLTIDSVTISTGDRVLLCGQTTASQNGPWIASATAWTRPSDWLSGATLGEGAYFLIDPDGATFKNTKWFCTNVGSFVVDTAATSWAQDMSGTAYSAGSGLTLSGTVFAAKINVATGLSFDGSANIQIVPDPNGLLTVSPTGIRLSAASASGQIIVSNASNNPAWVSPTGDVSVTAAGALSVNNISGSGFLKYGNLVANETPSGAINGSNTAFTLANANAYALSLYLNGQLLEPGIGNDYTLSANAINTLFAPLAGDKIRAYYFK